MRPPNPEGPMPLSSLETPEASTDAPVFGDATGLKNMQQLIQLRWLAVVGQLGTVLLVHFGLGIRLPLEQMLTVLGGLAVFNLANLLIFDVASAQGWRRRREV